MTKLPETLELLEPGNNFLLVEYLMGNDGDRDDLMARPFKVSDAKDKMNTPCASASVSLSHGVSSSVAVPSVWHCRMEEQARVGFPTAGRLVKLYPTPFPVLQEIGVRRSWHATPGRRCWQNYSS